MDTLGKRIIEDGDMSGALVSEAISLNNVLHMSIHAIWTGTPSGTLVLEVSGEVQTPTTWEPLSSVAAGGAAGSQLWLDRNAPYAWARVTCSAGGTGTLNVIAVTKGDE